MYSLYTKLKLKAWRWGDTHTHIYTYIHTGISYGNGSYATKRAGGGGCAVALIVAVEGIGSVILDGVWVKADTTGVNGPAISPSTACIVQASLQCLIARITPRHTPCFRPYTHHIHADHHGHRKG